MGQSKQTNMSNVMDADVSYCIGLNIGENIKSQDLANVNTEEFLAGIRAILNEEKPKFEIAEANQILQSYFEMKNEVSFGQFKSDGESFLNENKTKTGVHTTESGLQYEVISEGSGNKPLFSSQVTVHYHGTLIDGTVFDSSYERGTPATFPLNQVIKGWTEGLQLMSEGSKYRFYIPQELAYGANPHPNGPIKPYMALVFDVELLEVVA